MNPKFISLIRPILFANLLLTLTILALWSYLNGHGVNAMVVFIANLILFLATIVNLYFQFKNLDNPNPNAIIRGIMAGMFLKLFVLAGAVLIYLLAAGANRNVNGVFAGMGLYIIYTWLEVKISLRLNPKK